MGMIGLKELIGIWLFTQIFIATFIINGKVGLIVDFVFLALLIVMYFGLKLIGV